jgi:hypothetical protein
MASAAATTEPLARRQGFVRNTTGPLPLAALGWPLPHGPWPLRKEKSGHQGATPRPSNLAGTIYPIHRNLCPSTS